MVNQSERKDCKGIQSESYNCTLVSTCTNVRIQQVVDEMMRMWCLCLYRWVAGFLVC
jgi:hypothetical protein